MSSSSPTLNVLAGSNATLPAGPTGLKVVEALKADCFRRRGERGGDGVGRRGRTAGCSEDEDEEEVELLWVSAGGSTLPLDDAEDQEVDGTIGPPPRPSNMVLLAETAPPHSFVGSPHAAVGFLELEEFEAKVSSSALFWVTVLIGIDVFGSPQDWVGAGGGIFTRERGNSI